MLQIYIYGTSETGYLDLLPGTTLEMENFTPLFDEDLATGEFSLPLEFPWTEKNRRLMGFAERLENFDSALTHWMVDVYDQGFPTLQHAKLTLLEKAGDLRYTRGTFNGSISGNKGLFGTAIKNKTLRNIDLGGDITWTGDESRKFATDLMKGLYPQFANRIAFAPVVNENFFDETKNYNGEFLAEDTLNNIVALGSGAANWVFGRPVSTAPTTATIPGQEEHIDHRTVPFFRFQYVLQKAFEAAGYTAQCDICTNTAYKDLYIFNNAAIDFPSAAVYADYTRKIVPWDHMPDLTLVEFFRAVFSAFNLFPVFSGTNNIDVFYRTEILAGRKVLDITNRCAPLFSAVYADPEENKGYTLGYKWDDADDYLNDRAKDITQKTMAGTVSSLPELATLSIGRSFTTDDIVLVENENMYYNVADATSTPILWDAWAERMQPYVAGEGDRTPDVGLGTLCQYVEFDEATALYTRRSKLATRQPGSYWTTKGVLVKNPVSLRIFYISTQVIGTNEVPVSHNHNTTPNGTVLAPYSLALQGSAGLAETFHKDWQDVQSAKQTVKIAVAADARLMQELRDNNTISINNVLYLPKKTNSSIPLQKVIEMEIVPI